MTPRFSRLLLFAVSILLYALPVRAQSVRELPERLLKLEQAEEREAEAWAAQRNLPLRFRQADGRLVQLVGMQGDRPVYLTSLNDFSALTTGTLHLYPGARLGLSLTGSGMEIGVWDAGHALATHQELLGRVTTGDRAEADDHATHVAGTLAARGVDSKARGMAYEAGMRSYNWTNDTAEMASEAARGLLVSNHSYGPIAGWYYGDLEDQGDRWYWLGHPGISRDEDYTFGWYDADAVRFDEIVFDNPFYLPVVAAGNDRGDRGPRSGSYRALDGSGNWQTYDLGAQPIPGDGGLDGFDSISGGALAKNVLTVGALGAQPAGGVRVSSFSSFGPTDDGRIKPDLVGFGEGVRSAIAAGPDRYAHYSGTSMATPNVAGSLLLLQEHRLGLTGEPLRAASLKGLALHTATDLGEPGPDYRTGWGLLNAEAAARHLTEAVENPLALVEESLANGAVFSQSAIVDEPGPLRLTLTWTDRPGARLALIGPPSLDDPTPQLRHDLDLRLRNETTGEIFLPYTLRGEEPSAAARPGDNVVDPIEQIFLPDAPAGSYTIQISHKGRLLGGAQPFALLVTGARDVLRSVAVNALEAEVDVDAVHLRWATLFERAPGTFWVERARITFRDGSLHIGDFVALGAVPVAGTDGQGRTYDFLDEENVLAGRHRYRLVFEDANARYVVAETEVEVPAPERYAVLSSYPNPSAGHALLVLDLPEQQPVKLEIFDALGRRVALIHNATLPAGRHELSVEATRWPAGVYFARVLTREGVRVHRMVVMR